MPLFYPFAALAGLNNPKAALDIHFQYVSQNIIKHRLSNAPRANSARDAAIRRMFLAAGCPADDVTREEVSAGQPPNLICTMPGDEPSVIVISGHLDKVRKGDGVVDDWSGSSMLPSLYASLKGRRRKHTLVFIAFTEEEKGLVGSKYYVSHHSHAFLRGIRAEVNLECLGMNPPEVWENHAARPLLARLYRVAHAMGMIVPDVNLEWVGRDDAMSFRHRHVPTITIHSLTQSTVHVMHSKRDNLSAENMNDYYETYELVTAYLAYLDKTLP